MADSVLITRHGRVLVVAINRPDQRNAVDGATAEILYQTFVDFDQNPDFDVAILTGMGGHFCAGADLKAFSSGDTRQLDHAPTDRQGPMGPTRLTLGKPVLAAIEGYAVAGGLELALWCDLRIVADTAIMGVFCRRWGVPLIDLGTIRLPRLIGQSRAMDLILTGRSVAADEALSIGLANRVVATGTSLDAALALAHSLSALPQACLRHDRLSVLDQWSLPLDQAIAREFAHGLAVMDEGDAVGGAARFAAGDGRHGKPAV